MNNTKGIIVLTVALAVILALFIVYSDPRPEEVSPTEQIEIINLSASTDKVEIGNTVNLTLSGKINLAETINWKTSSGKIVSEWNKALLTPTQTGITTVTACIGKKEYFSNIEVFLKPSIDADIKPWIYIDNQYDPKITSVGVDSVNFWIEDNWNEKTPNTKNGVIFIPEAGNYQLIIEGRAKMDGRPINITKNFSAVSEIKRGYHSISMEEEDLLGLKPWQKIAIEKYLANKYGIKICLEEDSLEENGFKAREINTISTAYVFYRDSSRANNVCLQENVKTMFSDSSRTNIFFTKTVKPKDDARYWIIGYDGFIVTVSPDIPKYYLKHILPECKDNGDSNGGSSGGRSPSPPV